MEDCRSKTGCSLLFRLRRCHILREAFQRNLARLGRSLLRFIGGVLDESSLQHVIGFIAPPLALSALDRPPKFEPYALHGLGGKGELLAIELARLKEVIEKPAGAFRVGIALNKADNVSLAFDADLHKFAIAQEAVHAGVIRAGRDWARGPVPLTFAQTIRVRLRASQHPGKENETRKLQGVEAGRADRHAHLGTVSIAVMVRMRAKHGQQPFEVSYNLSTK